MNRLRFSNRFFLRAALIIELSVLFLVAWTCSNPGGCDWACADDGDCASTHSCVNGVCWNAECDERAGEVDIDIEVPSLCGNGIVDDGEDCDGDDMTGCLDTQECHNCQCVYVVIDPGCGNGIVDDGEDCDGDDMTGCLDTQECHNCQCVYMVGCGDGYCDTSAENTDLCPADCQCVNDGECNPGEGFNCADCGDPVDACGTPCETDDNCREPLVCFNNACWRACFCDDNCGGGEDGQEVECWCVGPDRQCSDGSWLYGACGSFPP